MISIKYLLFAKMQFYFFHKQNKLQFYFFQQNNTPQEMTAVLIVFPAFKVVTEKFCLKRLNKSSTCQRLLYRYKISPAQYSIPKDVIITIHPAQNSVSFVILCCFLDAVFFFRFFACPAFSFGNFSAITRT